MNRLMCNKCTVHCVFVLVNKLTNIDNILNSSVFISHSWGNK